MNREPTNEFRSRRERAVESFASEFLKGPNHDLYQEMLVTICRLAREDAGRGDVKLINKALAELRYGLKVFAPYSGDRKISIYGSSRTPEGHPDYVAAEQFGRGMSEAGWMVITGAGDGIMRAGHGGAGREASFGVAIRLPFEQKTNDIIAKDPKLVNFRYFFTRKLMFMKEASAIALFPGGFGTQDECFEALTLVQTGKSALIPIVMCEQPGGTYWLQWRAYVTSELLRTGMISEQDMNLFYITDDVTKAMAKVIEFYRVYHSSRYVGEDLVLRLNRRISDELVEQLNDEYAADILEHGRIEQCEMLPAERGEFPELPRLKMAFNKQSLGKLRRAFDLINASANGAEGPV